MNIIKFLRNFVDNLLFNTFLKCFAEVNKNLHKTLQF